MPLICLKRYLKLSLGEFVLLIFLVGLMQWYSLVLLPEESTHAQEENGFKLVEITKNKLFGFPFRTGMLQERFYAHGIKSDEEIFSKLHSISSQEIFLDLSSLRSSRVSWNLLGILGNAIFIFAIIVMGVIAWNFLLPNRYVGIDDYLKCVSSVCFSGGSVVRLSVGAKVIEFDRESLSFSIYRKLKALTSVLCLALIFGIGIPFLILTSAKTLHIDVDNVVVLALAAYIWLSFFVLLCAGLLCQHLLVAIFFADMKSHALGVAVVGAILTTGMALCDASFDWWLVFLLICIIAVSLGFGRYDPMVNLARLYRVVSKNSSDP